MKKKMYVVAVLLAMAVVAFFITPADLPVYAGSDDPSVEKALTLVKDYNDYDQAVEVLREKIDEDYKDNEARFHLGRLLMITGDEENAIEEWSAPAVRKEYGEDIAQVYMGKAYTVLNKAAPGYLDEETFNEAIKYCRLAVQADSRVEPDVINDFIDKAEFYPFKYVLLAKALNPAPKKINGLYEMVVKKANAQTDEMERVQYYHLAAKVDHDRYEKELKRTIEEEGQEYLDLALENARWAGKEVETEKYRNLAIVFLGSKTVNEKLPEKVCYYPREEMYVFKLVKGEKVDHRIYLPNGIRTNVEFFSDNHRYQIREENGEVINAHKGMKLPITENGNFEIIATEDTYVALRVTQLW